MTELRAVHRADRRWDPWRSRPGIGQTGVVNLDDVPQPVTAAAGAVVEVASTCYSPALLNHCLRSYV
jgi:hypothetical protein